MTLQPDERRAIVDYRISRARATLVEAVDNAELGHWNLVANRLYYAIFYSCSALLLSNHIIASSHAGVNRMIHLKFVRSGILSKQDGRLLSDLFNMRQTGDYDDIFDWGKEDIEPMIPATSALVDKIIKIAVEQD